MNMKVLIISGTPKHEGLCRSCVQNADEGIRAAGGDCEVVDVCGSKLRSCAACNEGWGTCRAKHVCQFGEDGFSAIQGKMAAADALVFISPVYWGDMSEPMKALFDRYRRCEATRGDQSALKGKRILLVASPGGTGNGMVSCFEQMERFCRHLGAAIFDFVGVNRWNRDYKLVTVRAAAAALVSHASEAL
jgi:multimeric flavodoxin WrbA